MVLLLAPWAIDPLVVDISNLPKGGWLRVGSLLWLVAVAIEWTRRRPHGQSSAWAGGRLSGQAWAGSGPGAGLGIGAGLFWLAVLGWSAASLGWAEDPAAGREVLNYWLTASLGGLAVVWSGRVGAVSRRLLGAVAMASGLTALLGLGQHLVGLEWVYQAAAPAATFVNKNMAAEFWILGGPALLAWVLLWGQGWTLGLASVGLGLTAAMVFHTTTKASWLAGGVIGAWMIGGLLLSRRPALGNHPWIWEKRHRIALSVAAGVFLAAIQVGPEGWVAPWSKLWATVAGVFERSEEAAVAGAAGAPAGFASESVSSRLILAQHAWRISLAHPAKGVGLENFAVHYPDSLQKGGWADPYLGFLRQPESVHNEYLQVLAELGWVGVALGLGLGIAVGRAGYAVWRSSGKGEYRLLGWIMAGALLGLAVNAAFSFPLRQPMTAYLAALYAAWLLAASRGREGAEQESPAAPPATPTGRRANAGGMAPSKVRRAKMQVAFGWGVAALGAWAASGSAHAWWDERVADRCYSAILFRWRKGDWRAVEDLAGQGQRIDPQHVAFARFRGWALLELGDPDRAEAYLRQYLKARPWAPDGHFLLARCRLARQDLAGAREAMTLPWKLLPREKPVIHLGLQLAEKSGRMDEARRIAREGVVAYPGDLALGMEWGRLALAAGELEEAALAYQGAVSHFPENPEALFNLGVVEYQYRKNRTAALPIFRRFLAVAPDHPQAATVQRIVAKLMASLPTDQPPGSP